jgi:hypothetical protein
MLETEANKVALRPIVNQVIGYGAILDDACIGDQPGMLASSSTRREQPWTPFARFPGLAGEQDSKDIITGSLTTPITSPPGNSNVEISSQRSAPHLADLDNRWKQLICKMYSQSTSLLSLLFGIHFRGGLKDFRETFFPGKKTHC